MKTTIWIAFLLVTACGIFAQNGLPASAGARGLAMGRTGLTFRDINSAFANPAGLAHLPKLAFMAGAENRFLTAEIQQLTAAAALPAGNGAWGITVQYFGFEGFNEQKLGLAYGRRLSDGITLGAQLFYFANRIPDYGTRHLLTGEIGLQATLLPGLQLAARIHNPVRQEIIEGAFLPTLFELGMAYIPADQLRIILEAEKDINFPVNIKSGLEYQLASPLYLRLGLTSNPASYSFGMGIRLSNNLQIDVASTYQQLLGFSPAIHFLYQGGRAAD